MRKRGFDRTEIEVFAALADGASVSAVAGVLGLHHSTVLRVLESIEARAGAPLFARRAGAYRLTEAGEALIGSARALRDALAGFEHRLGGIDERRPVVVRLTTSDGLAAHLVPRWLASFAQAHPRIEVQLTVSNTIADLRERAIDVALRPTRRPAEHLVGRRAGSVAYSLYASAAYLKTRGYDGTLAAQLAGHDVCGYAASLAFFSTAEWMEAHARDARVAARFDHLTAMREAAAAGLGIAALPCFMAHGDRALVRLIAPPAAMRTGLWVLTHPQLRRAPHVRALMGHLVRCVADEADLLDPVGERR